MLKIPIEIFKPNKKREATEYHYSDIILFKIVGDLYFDCIGTISDALSHIELVCGNCFLDNREMTSLKGSPRKVEGGFYCYLNNLTSLEGCPEEVGGDFSCGHNKKEFTEKYVRSLCKVGGNIYV